MRYFLPLLSFSVLSLGVVAPIAFAQPYEKEPDNRAIPVPVANPLQKPVPKPRVGLPEQQIKDDLTTFINKLNTSNSYFDMQTFIANSKMGFFGANEWFRHWTKQRDELQVTINEITVGKVENGNATATVSLKMKETNADKETHTRTLNEKVDLKLGVYGWTDEQFWQIVPPTKMPAEGANEPPLLQTIAYILAQQDWTYQDTAAPTSIKRLKQLGLGVMQFVQDYDERFAFAPKYAQEALMPYTKSQQVFEVPNTDETYTFNGNLCDKSLAQIDEPSKVVLFYEGKNEQPIFRYDGKAAIGFADGHCVLVSREEAKDLIWKP